MSWLYLLASRSISAIWNIECSDLAVLDRQTPRHEPTGCIKCTKCTVITSLTGCRVGNSALQRHGRGNSVPFRVCLRATTSNFRNYPCHVNFRTRYPNEFEWNRLKRISSNLFNRLKNKFKYQPKKFTQQFNHSIFSFDQEKIWTLMTQL